MIRYVLLPEGLDPAILSGEIMDDLVGYSFEDVNEALKASGYMSTVVKQTSKVYKMTVSVVLEEVK